MKRGRPVGPKDVTPRKRRTQEKLGTLKEAIKITGQFKIDKSIALKKAQIIQEALEKAHILNKKPLKRHILNEEAQVPKNCDILVSYVYMREKWD